VVSLGDSYALFSLDELVQFSQRTRNQHHNLRLSVPRLPSSCKAGIVKRIEDGLIFVEGGLGLFSSVLLREIVYVVVEEYDEVSFLLLLFVGGCHLVVGRQRMVVPLLTLFVGVKSVAIFSDVGGSMIGSHNTSRNRDSLYA